ncbi:DUF2975 domain-containing protein [Mycoplasmatota bacterium]|nr:DUF2975 domain-containing protein [Mycoplasmatota bacterium]
MKDFHVTYLKITTILAGLPILYLCLYQFPVLFIAGMESDSVYIPYLFVLMISIYIIAFPYIFALIETFKILLNIQKEKYFSKSTEKSLKNICGLAYLIAFILFLDLPFIYRIANMDDAPGLIVIGLFFMMFTLSIGVFAGLLKRIVTKQLQQDE